MVQAGDDNKLRDPYRRAMAQLARGAQAVLDAAEPQPEGWFKVPQVAMQKLWAAWLAREVALDADARPAAEPEALSDLCVDPSCGNPNCDQHGLYAFSPPDGRPAGERGRRGE
jgi:hypothetical protein